MELIWVLTGGDINGSKEEIKYYNLIEYSTLDSNIKIGNFKKSISISNPEKNIDLILQEIQKELDKGIKFLCKTDIYYNGTRLFKLGYYHKRNGEYKYTEFNITKNKIFYKKLVTLLIDNCLLDLP